MRGPSDTLLSISRHPALLTYHPSAAQAASAPRQNYAPITLRVSPLRACPPSSAASSPSRGSTQAFQAVGAQPTNMVAFEQARLHKLGSGDELVLQTFWSSSPSLHLLAEPDAQVCECSVTRGKPLRLPGVAAVRRWLPPHGSPALRPAPCRTSCYSCRSSLPTCHRQRRQRAPGRLPRRLPPRRQLNLPLPPAQPSLAWPPWTLYGEEASRHAL